MFIFPRPVSRSSPSARRTHDNFFNGHGGVVVYLSDFFFFFITRKNNTRRQCAGIISRSAEIAANARQSFYSRAVLYRVSTFRVHVHLFTIFSFTGSRVPCSETKTIKKKKTWNVCTVVKKKKKLKSTRGKHFKSLKLKKKKIQQVLATFVDGHLGMLEFTKVFYVYRSLVGWAN